MCSSLRSAECRAGVVHLRPMSLRDFFAWRSQRLQDEDILRPVEPELPVSWKRAHSWSTFRHIAQTNSFAIELNGSFVGQVTLNNGYLGYWVFSKVAGNGVATAAVRIAVAIAFEDLGLHRIAATYLPENYASARVLEKVGFQHEGIFREFLKMEGQWRDHHVASLLVTDPRPI